MATSPKDDAPRWVPAAMGAVGVGLLILVLASGGPDRFASPARLRAETEAAAVTALQAAGHPWGRFEVREDGVGVLSGAAPSPEAQSAALGALQAALSDRIGFPGVITRLEVDEEVTTAAVPVPETETTPAPEAEPTPVAAAPPPAAALKATPAAPSDLRVEVAVAVAPPPGAPSQGFGAGVRPCARALLAARAGRPIRFGPGSAEISPAARTVLADIAAAIGPCEGVKVVVEGHADAAGAAGANLALSLRRAEAAKDALVAAGAPGALLEARGRGEQRPVSVADNPVEQARNRRITFAVEPL